MSRKYFIFFTSLILFLNFSHQGFTQARDSVFIDSLSLKQSEGHLPNRKSFKSFLPGIAAVGYGVIALTDGPLKNFDHYIAERRNERRPNFSSHTDDYLRYVPFVALYGLEVLGVKGKHRIADKTGLMLLSGVIVMGSVSIVKKATDKERPDHSDFVSFPSGHAAIAFAGAELINQEYGDVSPWYSIGAYTVASATAVLRVYNNAHWFSDVVAGAGIGILSTKVAYLVYPTLKRLFTGQKNLSFSAAPFYQNQAVGLSIAGKF